MKGKIYTVSQLNGYVKRLFERDAFLADVFVQGEISNLKLHSSGHIYFTLKDKTAQISCVMFSAYASGLGFLPENGIKVTVYGSVSLYEKTGAYQLYVKIMEPAGVGALYLAYEQLKEKLSKKGIFDEAHKKPIPEYPKCIAVLTSPTGAAVRDIISISGRRNPNVEIVVAPVIVQGEYAAESIVKALELVNRWKGCDVIILGRGGGSLEDLWAFNEEEVAMAVYRSRIPVISAVGHETDFTITDFAADLRAATPSAAAELAVKKSDDISEIMTEAYETMTFFLEHRLKAAEDKIHGYIKYFTSERELRRIYDNELYISELYERLNKGIDLRTATAERELNKNAALLNSLSPFRVLERGYSIVKKGGGYVSSAKELIVGDKINILFKDGELTARIDEREEKDG
ncbi:MAG: exodeoxyribonuclease VII large subunit [Clostridiales bacterium]|nr:exodeoxyribonuclease VII large subunit [Clostridiales bacterium]MCD8214107.1 exodeoxyribonuclease VII large subunit [Clostridiales bacterium]